MRTSKVLMLLAAAAFFGGANEAAAQDHGSVSFVTGTRRNQPFFSQVR